MSFPIISSLLFTIGLCKISKILIPREKTRKIQSDKPIIIINPFKTLINYRFDIFRFNYVFTKRPYTEEFLFNLGYIYDIFFITDNNLVNRKVYNFIDPLGVTTYRLFTKDVKTEIENIKKNNKIIILDNKDTNDEDSLNIKSFSNKSKEFELLDVLNFLTTLNMLKIQNYSQTLKTYKNKDFYKSFDLVQKKIFRMRNMLNIFSNKKYESVKEQKYKEKIENYKIPFNK